MSETKDLENVTAQEEVKTTTEDIKAEDTEEVKTDDRIVLDFAQVDDIKEINTADAVSKYFVKKDNNDISFNSLSQMLKYYEREQSKFCEFCIKTFNNNNKMNVNQFQQCIDNFLIAVNSKIKLY